jgi:hypothetical protein
MISFGTCNSSLSEYIHVPSSTTIACELSFVNNILANVVVWFWQNSSCDICSKSKCFGPNSVTREFLELNDTLSVMSFKSKQN